MPATHVRVKSIIRHKRSEHLAASQRRVPFGFFLQITMLIPAREDNSLNTVLQQIEG